MFTACGITDRRCCLLATRILVARRQGLHPNRGHLSVCKLHCTAPRHIRCNTEADESSGHEPSITLCVPVAPLLQLHRRDVPGATVCGPGCHNTLQFASHLLLDAHHIFRRVENYQKIHKKASDILG